MVPGSNIVRVISVGKLDLSLLSGQIYCFKNSEFRFSPTSWIEPDLLDRKYVTHAEEAAVT
jgi:hypothetical protein